MNQRSLQSPLSSELHRASARPINRAVLHGLLPALIALMMSNSAFAQGAPAPGLAPLQPKVPLQPAIPTLPRGLDPNLAPDLVFVTQAMQNNVQRQPIIVKNIGRAQSAPTTVGCQGGGVLPPPENAFMFVEAAHAVKALAPGEIYELLRAPLKNPVTQYECTIRPQPSETQTTNNTFKWVSGSARSLTAPIQPGLTPVTPLQRTTLKLESINMIETNATASGDYTLSFRVHAKNTGNTYVENAKISCSAGGPPSERGALDLNQESRERPLNLFGPRSAPGESHIVAFDLLFPLHKMKALTGRQGWIHCVLKYQPDNGGRVQEADRRVVQWAIPVLPALNFPIYSR